jgi:hypothetical protein
LFEVYRVVLTSVVGLRIKLPSVVEVQEPVAESSKTAEKREKERKREKKTRSKDKGKGKERSNEEGSDEVEGGMPEFDERTARRTKLWELRIKKSVEVEVLKNEIESIDRMLEI